MTDDSRPKPKSWLDKLSHFLTGEPKDREDLIDVLRDAEHRHLLNAEALSMIEGVMQVSEMQVRDIMIPRAQMTCVFSNQGLEEILPIIIDSGHSRFPVFGSEPDEVIGILMAKDLLKYYFADEHHTFNVQDILRPVPFVPESKRLNTLLKEFRDKHYHLAVVADEYGGIAGLVTIEDVLEQIVGDIEDEYDLEDEEFIRKHAEDEYTVNALTPIEDFNETLSANLSDDEFDTIGGLVLHELGHLPKRGEKVSIGPYHFTILHADNRRVRLLRMRIENIKDQEQAE